MNDDSIPLGSEEFYLLNEVLEEKFGLSFPEQKKTILESRLRPRLRSLRLSSFMDYYRLLQTNANGELLELAKRATNNETYFFRETNQLDALFGEGIDLLQPQVVVRNKLRVLCAGCSSGEEPYTIRFFAADRRHSLKGLSVEIDAFDIDTDRINIARKAVCRPRSLRAMTDEQINRYLIQHEEEKYEVRSCYRGGVTFSHGNIIEVESYRRPLPYDAVLCRNVLIYFSDQALRRAIDNFADVLRLGGVLFLGHSESIIGMTPRFETVRLGHTIAYRKIL